MIDIDIEMDNDIKKKRQWLNNWVEAQIAAKLIERKAYYDSLAEDDDVDEPFDVWNEDMSVIRLYQEQATLFEIEQLEATTQRNFPETLKNFWQQVGTFTGEINIEEMTFKVFSVSDLIHCFADDCRPYEKLTDLGLINIMNWVWSNGHSILELEPGQFIDNGDGTKTSHEQLVSINNKYTCFGILMDGYCESHIFLHYEQNDDQLDQPGKFGMTYWHQDNLIPFKQDLNGFDSPEDILIECFKGYEAIREDDSDLDEDDNPYFDLNLLSKWLVANSDSKKTNP